MKTESMRAAYLRGDVTHHAYYSALADLLGVRALAAALPGRRKPQEWAALITEDRHLNNVPLADWDGLDWYVRGLLHGVSRDDLIAVAGSASWSLSDSVCVLKCVARRVSDGDVL